METNLYGVISTDQSVH